MRNSIISLSLLSPPSLRIVAWCRVVCCFMPCSAMWAMWCYVCCVVLCCAVLVLCRAVLCCCLCCVAWYEKRKTTPLQQDQTKKSCAQEKCCAVVFCVCCCVVLPCLSGLVVKSILAFVLCVVSLSWFFYCFGGVSPWVKCTK